MSDMQEIAKKLDELSLEELREEADKALGVDRDIPRAGGDYDTILGWTRRLGFKHHSKITDTLIPFLEKNGLAERNVQGVMQQGSRKVRVKMLYSPHLAKLAAQRDAESGD